MDSTTNTQSNIHNDWSPISFKEILAALEYKTGKTTSHFNDYGHDYYYYPWLQFESIITTSYLGSTLSKTEDKLYDPENEPKLIP